MLAPKIRTLITHISATLFHISFLFQQYTKMSMTVLSDFCSQIANEYGTTKWPTVIFNSAVTAADTTVGEVWANTVGATS